MNSSGTHVVLTRFPSSGTLSTFGLTPANITHLVIPNNLEVWPDTALDGCANLELITVHGPETDQFSIELKVDRYFQNLTRLKSIQLPSTITLVTRKGMSVENATFLNNVTSITPSRRLKRIENDSFRGRENLFLFHFSNCRDLEIIDGNAFLDCIKLRSADLSDCSHLKMIRWHAFCQCYSLVTVIFPSSEFQTNKQSTDGNGGCSPFKNTPIKTVIWKGRSAHPSGFEPYTFSITQTITELVSSGQITEIFLP